MDRRRNFVILNYVVAGILLVYVVQLFSLQIANGYLYSERASTIQKRQEILLPQRGNIYDANGKLLVTNSTTYDLYLSTASIRDIDIDVLLTNLARHLALPRAELHNKIISAINNNTREIEIASRLTLRDIAYIIEHPDSFPSVRWQSVFQREYLYGELFAHVLGYTGALTVEEQRQFYNRGYHARSQIGKDGVEKSFDSYLRGSEGSIQVSVDAHGNRLDVDNAILADDGNEVQLTLDSDIQRLSWEALGHRVGTIVTIRPYTGEVLSMVSYPSFDPNKFYDTDSKEYIQYLRSIAQSPYINRAIHATYPPASTFKTIVAASIIEEDAFSIHSTVYCKGYFELGNLVLYDWNRTNFGNLNLVSAFANSSNVYFWTVSTQYLGIEPIVNYSHKFGFGQKTGIDLPHEVVGIVPDPEWKRRVYGERWTAGDTANFAIGQGYLTVTPLQLATMVSSIVNDGIGMRPHVVKEIRDSTTKQQLLTSEPQSIFELGVSNATLDLLRHALRAVITEGTANIVITTDVVAVAGKTGTGEIAKGSDRYHSWFVAYAPFDAPIEEQVVVVVLVDANNEWEWWAPKAANIILHGIFTNLDFDSAVDNLKSSARGLWYL